MLSRPCRQGEKGDNCYVVEHGTFEAIKDGVVKHTYADKGSFGELALLYNTPRAATVQVRGTIDFMNVYLLYILSCIAAIHLIQ